MDLGVWSAFTPAKPPIRTVLSNTTVDVLEWGVVNQAVLQMLLLAGPIESLITILRPFAPYVLAAVFFGFFASAAVAAALYQVPHVRTAFVAAFFTGLLLVNFVAPVSPVPFVAWGHFSEPTPEVVEHAEIRFVDERGNELKIDDRLTMSFDSVSTGSLTDRMLTGYDEERREEVSRYLVLEATNYRERVENPPVTDRLRYPHHGLTSTWTPELLAGYGEFVGIRIYQMRFVTSADGTEVVEFEEHVVFESYPLGTIPERGPVANTEPTRSMNRTASGNAGTTMTVSA